MYALFVETCAQRWHASVCVCAPSLSLSPLSLVNKLFFYEPRDESVVAAVAVRCSVFVCFKPPLTNQTITNDDIDRFTITATTLNSSSTFEYPPAF